MRLDVYLSKKGFAKSRTMAAKMINNCLVSVNGKIINKCAFQVFEKDNITIEYSDDFKYVSRGGLKLEAAIENFKISVEDKVCADIGASTGGFTDCLLQNGAKKVYAIENGSSQLDKSLLLNDKVVSLENINARYMSEDLVKEKCDIVVMDVSFISQTLIYGAIRNISREGSYLITLIKPQFETSLLHDGRKFLSKCGIIKDVQVHKKIISVIRQKAHEYNIEFKDCICSPIKGGDGNTEYLALFEIIGKHDFVCPKFD